MSRHLVAFTAGSIVFLLCLSSCSRDRHAGLEDTTLKQVVETTKDKYCPDHRVAVFDVTWERHGEQIVLKGEVDNEEAKNALIRAVATVPSNQILDSIAVLPDSSLGEKKFGIVTLSVGNVRGRPGEAEELTTQALMGMIVKILKQRRGYYYVQLHDRYLGWLDVAAVHTATSKEVDTWTSAPKVIVTTLWGMVRERPSAAALPVCDVVAACLLERVEESGQWIAVKLPDGRKGFVERSIVQDYKTWKHTRRLNGDNIARVAESMLGIPYLWGGTSPKGMDCSGFTKTVFRLNGLELQRDADQQAAMGDPVSSNEHLKLLQRGDLLFFGQKANGSTPERITHVGIYLDNQEFIHCSGRVRLSSFDPQSPRFDERTTRRFVRARRVIPETHVPEVSKVEQRLVP